ncbi:MAG: hypothetical protein QG627_1196 [Chlamydiota bacterium]|jgi:hypothetical protein|nr:hypothetical protein [Chlamydiota bacterium]
MINEAKARSPYLDFVDSCYRKRDAHDLAKLIYRILCEIFSEKN